MSIGQPLSFCSTGEEIKPDSLSENGKFNVIAHTLRKLPKQSRKSTVKLVVDKNYFKK